MLIIISFIIGLVTDITWTKYTTHISKGNKFYAANWSLAIYLCGVYATYLLIDKEYVSMIAYMIGGYIGTYYAVSNNKQPS
jgi:hypothetical protein